MCVGEIATLEEVWAEDGVLLGRVGGGRVVPLAYVAEARPGDALLLHLGIPVEVLEPQAAERALDLRTTIAGGEAR